jgi:hypothetical protein
VRAVDRDGDCLFRMFRQFVAFKTIQNNVRRRMNRKEDYNMYIGKITVLVVMSAFEVSY